MVALNRTSPASIPCGLQISVAVAFSSLLDTSPIEVPDLPCSVPIGLRLLRRFTLAFLP